MDDKVVEAANRLTARWARALGAKSSVLSGAGAWPLLALLAETADGQVRADLQERIGIPADGAAAHALELLAVLDRSPSMQAALGVWTHREAPPTPWWQSIVPEAARGELTGEPGVDQPVLDAWAKQRTAGLIDKMPVSVTEDTMVVLATALAMHTEWTVPFEDVPLHVDHGPWATDDTTPVAALTRTDDDLSTVTVADTASGRLTSLTVRGTDDIDVHLVLGASDVSPGDVLGAAVEALGGPRSTAVDLSLGVQAPGLTMTEVPSTDPTPLVEATTVRFTVSADHSLLKHPEVFGLEHATDRRRGHFPGISATPLAVSQAKQSAIAEFTAVGFRAAAITAISLWMSGVPAPNTTTARRVTVDFIRPFGFLAVHRPTSLVLAAGWVAQPQPTPAEQW